MNAVTRFLKLSSATALAAVLCACASVEKMAQPTDTTVDPNSPAAAEVARMAAEPTQWPKFTDIPPVPSDLRTSPQWRQSVLSLQAAGDKVLREGAESTFDLRGDTDAWAASVKSSLDARASAPVTDAERADSAAFVAAAKARATPPPRPH